MKSESLALRLKAWLTNIPIHDPVERRMATLLQVILIGLIAVVMLATLLLVAIPDQSVQEKINVLRSNLFGFLVVGLPLALLRRGYFRASMLIITSILFITPTLAITVLFDLLHNGGILFQFTLAIILAGLLVSRRALIITLGLSVAAVGFAAFRGQNAAPQLAMANLEIALNFILFNGLIALFLDQFGVTLRAVLNASFAREGELQNEVSSRKQTEGTLRESEERYRKLIEHARDVIFTVSEDGRITSLSPSFEIFTGWSRAEWLGRSFDELVAEGDRARAQDQFNRILHGETLRALRLQMHTRSGEMLVVEMNISPQFRDDRVIGLLGIARDMTREQQAEDALKASEKAYANLLKNITGAVYRCRNDKDWTVEYVSEGCIELMGYRPEEIIESRVTSLGALMHPHDVEPIWEKCQVNLAVRKACDNEYRIFHRNGEMRWVRDQAQGVYSDTGELIYIEGLITDVTESKQAEEALRESEARYHYILDKMMEGCQIIDFDWRYLYVNEAVAAQQARLRPEEMLNHTVMELYPGVENTDLFAVLWRCMEERAPAHLETQFSFPDGRIGWFELSIQPAREGIFLLSTDITERKRAEEKLEQQNQRLKVLREIDTAILAADSVESIVGAALSHIRELIDCQRANLTLIDRETNELVIFEVRTPDETSIPRGARLPLAQFQDIIQTLSQNQPILLSDLRAQADPSPGIQRLLKDGLRSTCSQPLFSQGNLIGMFSLHSDTPGFFNEDRIGLGREVANQVAIAITQSRLIDALEQRLSERENLVAELSSKNAELENFTYTVSHDLKSPLVTMRGFLGYLEQDILTGNVERLKVDTQRIANAVDKMTQLLNDLLELSRVGRFVNPPALVPFEEIAREALELVHGQIKEAGITVQLQPGLPAVYGDRQRLIEVLQNLLDNAAKYMGDQPEPHIEIGQRSADADTELGNPIFYIKDNGVGVAPEYHERIFGLFNKLDVRTEGTGIGLALVRRIIEFHGGRVWVESEEGQGATFCLTLPGKGDPT